MTIWMLYAIVFGLLTLVAAQALSLAVRAMGRPARFVWVAALAVAAVGPLVLSLVMARQRQASPVSAAATPALLSSAPLSSPTAAATGMRLPSLAALRSLDKPVLIGWAVITLVLFGRVVGGVVNLRRKRREWVAREIDGTELLVTPDIGPAVVAMPESRIIVPEWVFSLDAASLATVIRHERQHSKAHDGWLIAGGAVIAAALPWNAAIWMIRRRMRLAIEMDCDARVLAEEGRVDRYGSLLLTIAQRPRFATALGATLTESSSDLERRIDAMTTRPPKNPRIRATVFAVAGLAVIGAACVLPAPDVVAPRATDVKAAGPVLYDFQVERPVSAKPKNLPPRYPTELRANGVEGSVIAKFVVDTAGRIEEGTVEILKADHGEFATAVRKSLPLMEFHPARVGERPVRQLVQMPFHFSVSRRSDATASKSAAASPATVSNAKALPSAPIAQPMSDTLPIALPTNQPPRYPPQLLAANISGQVIAKFVVTVEGVPDMTTFEIQKSDHDAFTAAVRAAVPELRFKPALKDGVPVAKEVTMPFKFSVIR
jgi:TonB family protein